MKLKNYIYLVNERDDDPYSDLEEVKEEDDEEYPYYPVSSLPWRGGALPPSPSSTRGGDDAVDEEGLPVAPTMPMTPSTTTVGDASGGYGGDDVEGETDFDNNNSIEAIKDITNAYLLKKIYTKLLVIENIIKVYTNDEFEQIKEELDDAIEMIEVVVNNYDLYKGKINEIIDEYQNFLRQLVNKIYSVVRRVRRPQNTRGRW